MLDIFLLNVGSGPVQQTSGESEVGKLRKGTPCWFDLHDPTPKEEEAVERYLSVDLPTRGEMSEIEISSRIYMENGALYLTALLVAGAQRPAAHNDAITFVLAGNCIATIRYHDPTPIRTFKGILMKAPPLEYRDGARALVGLLDTSIDRLADILEIIGTDMDALSRAIFLANLDLPEDSAAAYGTDPAKWPSPSSPSAVTSSGKPPGKVRPNHRDLDLRQTIAQLGRSGDLISKARESLVSINRLLVFLTEQCQDSGQCAQPPDVQAHIAHLVPDLQSLLDHASFLNGKVAFLLDATLGLINVEQNQIIKIFSIAAVIFLPPTLVASIYGMNFAKMPELGFHYGYPMALGMMVISGVIPYLFFKHKGWV